MCVICVLLTLSRKSPGFRPSIVQSAYGLFRVKVRAHGLPTSVPPPPYGGFAIPLAQVTTWRLIIVPLKGWNILGTNLTKQNSIQEGNKCRLKSQNACYRSVQNLLSSSLLSKNIKIKVYRTTVFPLFCKGVKLGQNKKKTTRLPLLTHSRNCYTCNQTLKMKRRGNFNDIRECILWNN